MEDRGIICGRARYAYMRGFLGLLLFAIAAPASAEWFADIYGGVAYTSHSDITIRVGSPAGPADHTFYDVKWDKSPVLGARAGYWLEAHPWFGVGLDVFRFSADVPMQTVDTRILGASAPATLQAIDFSAVVLALDVVRLRYPLMVGAEYPTGRLQPYFAGGPALFKVKVTNKANGEFTTQPATDTATGYKVGGGLSWYLRRAWPSSGTTGTRMSVPNLSQGRNYRCRRTNAIRPRLTPTW